MKCSSDLSMPVFAQNAAAHSFSDAELAPVYELNALFLEKLVDAAHRKSGISICYWAQALEPQLSQLTPESRVNIARCPICLIDAGFQEEERWEERSRCPNLSHRGGAAGVPDEEAVELTEKTVTLAWAVAKLNLEAACIIFGMTARCARIVSEMGIHRLSSVAALNAHHIRPLWADDPHIWRHLLNPAASPPLSRLPPLHTRAMLRQLAEVWLATPASEPTQHSRP